MTDLTLMETMDAIKALDISDEIERQGRIERHFNPLQMSRVSIFRDGMVDVAGIVAVRYQDRYIHPPKWYARLIVRAWEFVTLRRAK